MWIWAWAVAESWPAAGALPTEAPDAILTPFRCHLESELTGSELPPSLTSMGSACLWQLSPSVEWHCKASGARMSSGLRLGYVPGQWWEAGQRPVWFPFAFSSKQVCVHSAQVESSLLHSLFKSHWLSIQLKTLIFLPTVGPQNWDAQHVTRTAHSPGRRDLPLLSPSRRAQVLA